MKLVVWPYHMRNASSRKIAKHFGVKRVFPNRNYRYKPNHVVLNWGNSRFPAWHVDTIGYLNNPNAVRKAVSKLEAFYEFSLNSIRAPNVYLWKRQEDDWLVEPVLEKYKGESPALLARTLNNSFGGRGIVPVWKLEDIPEETKFLVQFIPKDSEYRVHVFNGKVIGIQQKRKRKGIKRDKYVWSYKNGSVFCVNKVDTVPDELLNDCVMAVSCLGLHFGAVDVVYTTEENKWYVLEVNTAPNLRSPTIFNAYVNAIKECL